MNGFSIWQSGKNASLCTVSEDQDSTYTFLLVGNQDPAIEIREAASTRLVIAHAAPQQQDTGKFSKILAGCTVHTSFMGKKLVEHLNRLPIFKDTLLKPCHLSTKQESEVRELFGKMEDVSASDYLYKKELVKVFILQLVHFMLKNNHSI